MSNGKIVQIIGAVVDVEFPRDQIPKIYDALKLDDVELTLEVQQQLGDGVVRTIAMGPSEGLRRGLTVRRHGQADLGAGGHGHARAASWTCSATRRTKRGPVQATEHWPIHRPAAGLRRAGRRPGPAGHRASRSSTCSCPFAKGGKVGLFGGAGVGKTVNMLELINNIAKQHSGPVGVRRRRRAHPRGQRLLSRDERVGRHRQGHLRTPRSPWCTAR